MTSTDELFISLLKNGLITQYINPKATLLEVYGALAFFPEEIAPTEAELWEVRN